MKILVLLVCGDISVHREWGLDGREYDLWISYYGDFPGKYEEDGDKYQSVKGFKWPIVHDLVEKYKEEVGKYDFVVIPDDDIKWTSGKIMEVCRLMEKYNITLGQPVIAGKGTCYRALCEQSEREGDGRIVSFVEIMTPIFRVVDLFHVMWTFRESSSGWGIDTIWAWEFTEKRLGAFDNVIVEHVRPQFRGEIYSNLKKQDISPHAEAARVHTAYGFPHCVTLGPLLGQ